MKKPYFDSAPVDKSGLMAGAIPWGWLLMVPFMAWMSFWYEPSFDEGIREVGTKLHRSAPVGMLSLIFLLSIAISMNRWPTAKEFVAGGIGLLALFASFLSILFAGAFVLNANNADGIFSQLVLLVSSTLFGIAMYRLSFAAIMKARMT